MAGLPHLFGTWPLFLNRNYQPKIAKFQEIDNVVCLRLFLLLSPWIQTLFRWVFPEQQIVVMQQTAGQLWRCWIHWKIISTIQTRKILRCLSLILFGKTVADCSEIHAAIFLLNYELCSKNGRKMMRFHIKCTPPWKEVAMLRTCSTADCSTGSGVTGLRFSFKRTKLPVLDWHDERRGASWRDDRLGASTRICLKSSLCCFLVIFHLVSYNG